MLYFILFLPGLLLIGLLAAFLFWPTRCNKCRQFGVEEVTDEEKLIHDTWHYKVKCKNCGQSLGWRRVID